MRDEFKCIITGLQTIEACHIFPLHAIKRLHKTDQSLRHMAFVWGGQRVGSLRQKLSKPDTQVIDTAANMLCMDRVVYEMWSQGQFALEPLDDDLVEPADAPSAARDDDAADETEAGSKDPRVQKVQKYGIRLRFHWLARTTLESPAARADFAMDPRQMWKPRDDDVQLLDANGRPIETGRIIDIYAEDDTVLPDREILQLQWDILRMHALSGGADASVYVAAFPPLDDLEVPAPPEPLPRIKGCLRPSIRRIIENRPREKLGLPLLPDVEDGSEYDDTDDDDPGQDGVSDVESVGIPRQYTEEIEKTEKNGKAEGKGNIFKKVARVMGCFASTE